MRLKWWGLYHDKPKVGTFMLRIKLAAGRLTAPQLRAIGQLSLDRGKGEAELTTRQNVQLHHLRLDALPEVFERLHAAGLTSLGGCGDTVRAITGCPAVGIAEDELFDVTPVLDEAHRFFTGNPDYVDLPRKHKISISACAYALQRAGDQLHLARRSAARRGARLLRPRRRRAVVRAAHRPRPRRVRPPGRGDAGAAGDPRHVARRPPLARLAREVADEVHGRRARAGGRAGRGRAAPRLRAAVLRAAADRRRAGRPPRHPRRSADGRAEHRRPGARRAPRRRAARRARRSPRAAGRARRGSRASRTSCSPTSRPPRSTPSSRRSATSNSRSSSTGCAGTGSPARASRTATTR